MILIVITPLTTVLSALAGLRGWLLGGTLRRSRPLDGFLVGFTFKYIRPKFIAITMLIAIIIVIINWIMVIIREWGDLLSFLFGFFLGLRFLIFCSPPFPSPDESDDPTRPGRA